jgi:hypothetical protein
MSDQFSHEKGFGFAVTIFVGSGGLGFILANLYHALLWCRLLDHPKLCSHTIDHRQAIGEARSERILCLVRQEDQRRYPVEMNQLSRKEAWRVLTALWHARIGSSNMLDRANARTDSLTSIVHGLGTLLMGTLIAAIASFFVSAYIAPETFCLPDSTPWFFRSLAESTMGRFLAFVVLAAFLVLAQRSAFRVAVGHAQGVIEMVFLEDLRDERLKKGRPVMWWVRPPQ